MSDQMSTECTNIDNSESSLHRILKNCANFQSSESLLIEDFNDVSANSICLYYKMLSNHSPRSTHSSSVSTSSYASDESFGDNILEENGRISLAYENLHTIPKRIAEKFATHTKCLDLSYNNFQNLSFLSYFEALHTLILDRNELLDVNTLPYLPNLRILWINNCNISNVTEWIQRIQMQCPVLGHLSIMGNPGIKANFSFCTLTSNTANDPIAPTSVVSDYREYILQVLPNLENLDGEARCSSASATFVGLTTDVNSSFCTHYPNQQHPSYQKKHQQQQLQLQQHQHKSSLQTPSMTDSINSIKNSYRPFNGNCFAPNSNNNSDNGFLSNSSNNNSPTIKNAPILSFKEIFRLKRRRKSFFSASAN